jgi:hypothetical protein
MNAWQVIPINALITILSEIRNRILNFVLKIEAEAPEAGEAALNSTPVPSEKVQQIFNTTINGNVGNLATSSHNFKQQINNTETNVELFNNLINALTQVQDQEIRQEISTVVREMQATQGTSEFKDNYMLFTSFLSNHITIYPTFAPYLSALAALIN